MRQLILETEPNKNNQIVLSGKTYKYLCGVLRLKSGDSFDARLLDGRLVVSTIQKIDTSKRTVIVSVIDSPKETDKACLGGAAPLSSKIQIPNIVLFQWLLKNQKMDQVIRQATEAGISYIIPVLGEYCVSQKEFSKNSIHESNKTSNSLNFSNNERWFRIIKEARQQSGSAIDTKILEPVVLEKALEVWKTISEKKSSCSIVFTENLLASNSLHHYLSSKPEITAVAIGAEGGFSPDEIKKLSEESFLSYHFNTNILRAETATLYGIATVQSILSEM